MKIKIKRLNRLIKEVAIPPNAPSWKDFTDTAAASAAPATPEAKAASDATDKVRTAIVDELPRRRLTVAQLNQILTMVRGAPVQGVST